MNNKMKYLFNEVLPKLGIDLTLGYEKINYPTFTNEIAQVIPTPILEKTGFEYKIRFNYTF